MPIWEIIFFPPSGERHSPVDAVRGLTSKQEAASLHEKLINLSEREMADWPTWIKHYQGLYQLKSNDFRVYIGVDKRKLVVCHVCRKVAQKARSADIEQARVNWNNYKANR